MEAMGDNDHGQVLLKADTTESCRVSLGHFLSGAGHPQTVMKQPWVSSPGPPGAPYSGQASWWLVGA